MTKEGDIEITSTESALGLAQKDITERNNPKFSAATSGVTVADDLVHSKSHVENCAKFVDALLLATEKTFDHFIAPKSSRPILKRKDDLAGVKKTVVITGKKNRYLPSGYFDAKIEFVEPKPAHSKLPELPRIGFDRRAIGGGFESLGTFRAPYSLMASEIEGEALQNDMARYIAKIMEQSTGFINQNNDDTSRIREIALGYVQDAVGEIFHPRVHEVKRAVQSAHSNAHDFKALSDAVTQTIERTFDDLLPADGKRPKVSAKIDLKGSTKSITIKAVSKNWTGIRMAKDFEITISFNTKSDAKFSSRLTYANSTSGGTFDEWGRLTIPYNTGEETITDVLDEKILGHIVDQICAGIQYRKRILTSDNNHMASRLKEIVREHLDFALAGAFGSDYRKEGQPLVLAAQDTKAAEQTFRTELKALRDSNKSDFYLLTIFGVAAMASSAEDASVINEWETARAFSVPPTMNKIRHINKTLKTLNGMDKDERAQNARELLSQIRSMQKSIARDLKTLSADAGSIHGAKTIMNAHEENLKKYVQGFEAIRGDLTEKFGEASVSDKAIDLKTALSAAQVHNAAQTFTHEMLSSRMLRNISSLSTSMSFVAQSMSQLVSQSAQAAIGHDEELETLIDEKIEALLQTFEPLAIEADDIEEQLAIEGRKEPLLMITHQQDNSAFE